MSREMKDSGIDWIGEIPSNWDIKPIKRNYKIISGATPKSNNEENWGGDITWITPADFKASGKYIATGRKNITEKGYNSCSTTIVPTNSIIFSKRAPVGTVAINSNELCTNQGCLSCVPFKEMNSSFGYYSMLAGKCIFEISAQGTTFMEISANDFANIKLPIAPLEEQEEIAKFLDVKCESIDQAIQKQKDIVIKLKEYKQSTITQAVTKGLNRDKEMKASKTNGVDKIPVTWNDMKIKYLGTFCNGLTYHPEDICGEDEGMLVLRSSNIQNGKLDFNDTVYVKCSVPSKIKIKKGDIIICSRNGSAKLIGKNALITDDMNATFGAFMMIFRCDSPRYMYYVLNSKIWETYLSLFTTTTINQLTSSTFGNLVFPYTFDKDEQCHIVKYLDDKCEKIDYAVAHSIEIIERLEEYKNSLIYNAVTGKIDCRGEIK